MKLMGLLIVAALLWGCTITIAHLKQERKVVQVWKAPTKKRPKTVLVDSHWLEEYRDLEEEHGSYTIPEDRAIEAVGDKFRVPMKVKEHFQDLTRAATPAPIPTP